MVYLTLADASVFQNNIVSVAFLLSVCSVCILPPSLFCNKLESYLTQSSISVMVRSALIQCIKGMFLSLHIYC